MDDTSECPFCGGLNIFMGEFELDLGWGVLCLDCQASGPQCASKEEAYSKWHERFVPDIDSSGNPVKREILFS